MLVLSPKGSSLMLPPNIQMYLQPPVALTFNLLTTKVDGSMLLLRGPFVRVNLQLYRFIYPRQRRT